MNLTLKAIIARHDGNLTAAMNYCSEMAQDYPNLAKEYMSYFNEILALTGSHL
jgi:hypothetical protein